MKRVFSLWIALVLLLGMAANAVSATAVLSGDINGDGHINNRDLGLLQQYLGDWDVAVDMALADVTADGHINNRDLGLLQQYLSDWDVRLAPDLPTVTPSAKSYDLDGKGRVFAECVARENNVISVMIANKGTQFITEETSYVRYICIDAQGGVLMSDDIYYGTLYFGSLELGESVVKQVIVPEGTVELEFGEAYIVYWTPWT